MEPFLKAGHRRVEESLMTVRPETLMASGLSGDLGENCGKIEANLSEEMPNVVMKDRTRKEVSATVASEEG